MRKTFLLAAIVVAAASLTTASVALGGGHSAGAGTVTAHASRFGKVLFDGRGRALYLFKRDKGSRSTCSGACAKAWPPLLTGRAPKAASRPREPARHHQAGRRHPPGHLRRTSALPLPRDKKPGQVNCENAVNFGGRWLVVSPAGKAVK
jgi:predicted lipoprotein with Yx(FWY)xxD motif